MSTVQQRIDEANHAVDLLPIALGSLRTETIIKLMLIQSIDRLALALADNTAAIRESAIADIGSGDV
jgi:hypothetical protein